MGFVMSYFPNPVSEIWYLIVIVVPSLTGTCRWGEFGEGGLLWGECNARHFEWFEGDFFTELLFKVHILYKFFLSSFLCLLLYFNFLGVNYFNFKVKDLFGLDEEVTFRNVNVPSQKRPRPLHLSTATQIGEFDFYFWHFSFF